MFDRVTGWIFRVYRKLNRPINHVKARVNRQSDRIDTLLP